MIGPRDGIPEACWREKLSPPRPLIELGGALYGAPLRDGAPAFVAWIFGADPDDALARAIRRARDDGASALYAGGPPGNYLVSGPTDAEAPWFLERGFVAAGRSVDLIADPRGVAPDSRVSVARDIASARAWITEHFGAHWAAEAQRAHTRHGLLICGADEQLAGFVAVGGNNAHAGTFGPVGVAPEFRGRGLGEALSRTALHALAAQGFTEVTIPWVDRATTPFYRGLARITREVPRVTLVLRFSKGSA